MYAVGKSTDNQITLFVSIEICRGHATGNDPDEYGDIPHVFTGTVRFVQSVTKDAWLQISTFLAVAAADVAEVVVDVVVLLLAVVLDGVADVVDVISAPALALVVAVAALPPLLSPLLFRWLSPTPSPTPNPNARMITNPIIIPQNSATGRPSTLLFFSVKFGCIGADPLY